MSNTEEQVVYMHVARNKKLKTNPESGGKIQSRQLNHRAKRFTDSPTLDVGVRDEHD